MPTTVHLQTPAFSYEYKATLLLLGGLSYTYTVPVGLTAEQPITHIYEGNDPVVSDKVIGYRSDYTQVIANGLQEWNNIRRLPSSTGQAFINAFAMGVQDLREYWLEQQRELFLETADQLAPMTVARHGMPDYIDLDKVTSPQLLVNSAFINQSVTRYNLPTDWTDRWAYSNGTVESYTGDMLSAGGCVRLSAETGQRAYIGQEQDFLIPKSGKLTFSVWYKTNENSGYEVTGDSTTSMKVSLTNDTRNTTTTRKSLKHSTKGKWTRDWMTVTADNDVSIVDVGVELDNTTGVLNTRDYYLDMFMLEESDHPTQWQPSIVDQPEWMRIYDNFYTPPFTVEVNISTGIVTGAISGHEATGTTDVKRPMWYIPETEMFLSRRTPPTRLTVAAETGDVNGTTNKIYGILANSIEEPFEKAWAIESGSSLVTYTWPWTLDTGQSYSIAEPNLEKSAVKTALADRELDLYHKYTVPATDIQQTGLNYTVSYEAHTIKDGMIWLVCQEAWDGTTGRVLKILNPKTERTTTYLELIKDFTLTGLTGTVTSVGFRNVDPPQMTVTMTGTDLGYSGAIVSLYYDYFTYDGATRQIYTRDLYTGASEYVVII